MDEKAMTPTGKAALTPKEQLTIEIYDMAVAAGVIIPGVNQAVTTFESLAEFASLARKEEREACSKAVCQNCANALPVKNSSQWIWIHEVPGIGIGPCHAAAIHSRNQEEGR